MLLQSSLQQWGLALKIISANPDFGKRQREFITIQLLLKSLNAIHRIYRRIKIINAVNTFRSFTVVKCF